MSNCDTASGVILVATVGFCISSAEPSHSLRNDPLTLFVLICISRSNGSNDAISNSLSITRRVS
jgi:hypothetical protein